VHVDPVEWWDPKWVADHVIEKLKSFQNPSATVAGGAPAAPAPATDAGHRGKRRR
jgi:hypothetical protein